MGPQGQLDRLALQVPWDLLDLLAPVLPEELGPRDPQDLLDPLAPVLPEELAQLVLQD